MIEHESDSAQLADQLDAFLPPHQSGVNPLNGDERVQAAARLANAPQPELSPEAVARLQARVLSAARQQQVQRRTTRFQTPLVLRWAAMFVLVMLGLSATLPTAASSLPGDLLYPVKRGFESVERLLAVSPDARASMYLTQAERRIQEAQGLLGRSQFDAQLIQEVQDDISQANQSYADLSPDVQARIEVRAAQLTLSATTLVQAAAAAGVVTPGEIDKLLPAPTEPPALTVQPLATSQPTATPPPPSSPTITPAPTQTGVPAQTTVPTVTLPPASPTTDTIIQPTVEAGVITVDSAVNVRKGPGTEFEIIAVVQPGTPVLMLGKSQAGDWRHIRLPDGRAGWISAALVGSSPPPSPGTSRQAGGSQNNQECEHPGNYCNAPGQQKNDTPGNNGSSNNGNNGNNGNSGNGNGPPANNPGQGNRPDKPPKGNNK